MHFNFRALAFAALAMMIIATGAVWLIRASDRAQQPAAVLLDGVWVYVGTPGNVHPAPEIGGRLKFRLSNHWTFTHADPRTGEVRAHFGGIYRVTGDEYSETTDYSMDPDDRELNRTLKFRIKIEGDTMTQYGIGNPYTEVWQRVR